MKNLCFLLLSIVLFLSSGIDAAERGKSSKDDCKLISSSDAIKKAKRQADGKVVSVKLKRAGAKSVYRVRVLTDGKKMKNITVKACR